MGWFDENQPDVMPAPRTMAPTTTSAPTGGGFNNGGVGAPPRMPNQGPAYDRWYDSVYGPGADPKALTNVPWKNPVQTPTPTTPGGSSGGAAPQLNRNDPASVDAFISYYASQPGANPSLTRDPGYWKQKISSGEFGDDPNYVISKFMTPEGAPAGSGGGGTYGHYDVGGGGGYGSLSSGFTQNFQGLTLDQLHNTPGYQFALNEGTKAVEGSAAAGGRLYTGGTLKALSQYATGLADQTFGQAYDRSRNEYLDAAGIFRNNQNDLFNRYYNLSSFGTQNPGNS